MKGRSIHFKSFAFVTMLALILTSVRAAADTHVVQFGGTFGFAYSPKEFSAKVGDTVLWSGDFSAHPLSSASIPKGAQSWHNVTGALFSYTIKVAGTYHYQCDVHFGMGMVGSFEATPISVDNYGMRQDRSVPSDLNNRALQ